MKSRSSDSSSEDRAAKVTRQPKGVPVGGRFAAGSHDAATNEMTQTLSERMDAIRDDGSRRREFSLLALVNTATITREIAPNAAILRLNNFRFAFHISGVFGRDGERIYLSDEDYARVREAVEEADAEMSVREHYVEHASDPEDRGRGFFYALDIDAAVATGQPRALANV